MVVKAKTKQRLIAIHADDPTLPAYMKRRIRQWEREDRGQPLYSFKTVEEAMARLFPKAKCQK